MSLSLSLSLWLSVCLFRQPSLPSLSVYGQHGRSSLMYAALQGDEESVRVLTSCEAIDLDATDVVRFCYETFTECLCPYILSRHSAFEIVLTDLIMLPEWARCVGAYAQGKRQGTVLVRLWWCGVLRCAAVWRAALRCGVVCCAAVWCGVLCCAVMSSAVL